MPEVINPSIVEFNREELVIQTYFSRPLLARQMSPLLDTALFDNNENKGIVKVIRQFIKKYDRIPNSQELYTGMESSGYAAEVRNKLKFICGTPVQEMDDKYCVDMIENFYKEKRFHQVLVKQAEHWHNHEMEAVHAMIPEVERALAFSLHANLGIEVMEDAATMLARLKEPMSCVPSRLRALRELTRQTKEVQGAMGGWYKDALSLFVAQPNQGKTMAMCSEAAYAVSKGYNVLYISLEMAEHNLWQRVVANLLDLEMWDVLELSDEECKRKLDDFADCCDHPVGKLRIVRKDTTTTPLEIEDLIEKFEQREGRKVDLLVIDYIGIMQPNSTRTVSEVNMFLDGIAKAKQIRDICVKRHIAGLSAIQFNRSGYGNLFATMSSVEGSAGYNNTVDLMVSITCNQTLQANGMLSHVLLKNRFGPKDQTFCARADFRKMRWFDASEDDIRVWEQAVADQQVQNNSQNSGGRPKVNPVMPPMPKPEVPARNPNADMLA